MPIENEPTVWMRSIAWHTYLGVPQEIGSFYLAHEEIVETIADVLHFAVRDTPPPRAVRSVAPTVPPPAPVTPSPEPLRRGRSVKPMTTRDKP